MLGADVIALVIVVVFLDFILADVDVRADFLADDFFGEEAVADVVLEIIPIEALRGDGLLECFHAGQFIFDANFVELLDDFRLRR